MTVIEAGAKDVIPASPNCYNVYRIGFVNKKGKLDETELDVSNLLDLDELWRSLYSEFDCDEDSIEYIQFVKSRRKELVSDEEFNAISHWTMAVKADDVFDIISNEAFEDFETGEKVSISEGMEWIAEYMAYHPLHDVEPKDALILIQLLLSYQVMSQRQIDNLSLE